MDVKKGIGNGDQLQSVMSIGVLAASSKLAELGPWSVCRVAVSPESIGHSRPGHKTDHRTNESVSVLNRVVRVVPSRAVLCYLPSVCKRVAWCDGALSYPRDPVFAGGLPLTNTMLVNL